MTMRGDGIIRSAILAAAILLGPGIAPAADNVVVVGKVVHRGKAVAGATVSVLDRTTVTDKGGAFRLEGIPAIHGIAFRQFRKADDGALEYRDVTTHVGFLAAAAFVETEEKTGFLGLFRRKVARGAVSIFDAADAPKGVTIEVADLADWEGYCRGCHPTTPAAGPWAVVRPMKRDAPKPDVTKQLFASHRLRDSHPSGFDYGKAAAARAPKARFRPDVASLPLGGRARVDCRTCHTFHLAGPIRAYARDEFESSGALCRRCHL